MSDQYYVMSESEFREALNACVEGTRVAEGVKDGGPEVLERMEKAEAACRAREVVLTLGEMGTPNTWWEIKK